MRRCCLSAFWFLTLVVASTIAAPKEEASTGVTLSPEDVTFFESNVRPILVERCYECHSDKKQKGGLRLDSLPAWRAGGDSGEVITPGDPGSSLLISAIRYATEDLQMPPKQKLNDHEISLLTEWVKRGAPDPRVAAAAERAHKITPMTLEQARAHWAFQPIIAPAVPPAKKGAAVRNDIDRFVQARLQQEALKPNPPADPRTLVRRAYLTLIGLPPSYDRVEQFVAKPSPAAFSALVDHLLSRPEYGQRWARHWLDVARFADTTDKSTDSERRIPFAHTYRDYVIDTFNSDRPFNRFVLEQLAADRLPPEEKPDLRALGFLTVGRRFEGNIEAPELIIDDRIDTIGRGLLGLTLACARCHDHKFDAIPAADYYSLSGILASSREPLDLPEVAEVGPPEAVAKYRADRAAIFAEYEKHIDACVIKAKRLLRELAPEYLRRLVDSSPQHRTVEGFIPLDTPRGLLVRGGAPRWEALIEEGNRRGVAFFRLWPTLIESPREGFSTRVQSLLDEAFRHPELHDSRVLNALRTSPPASMLEVADAFGKLITEALQATEETDLARFINAADSPLQFTREEVAEDLLRFVTEHQLVSRPDGEAAGKLRERLTILEANGPVDRAQAVAVVGPPVNPHIMIRGDRRKLGAEVPRRFPQVLASLDHRLYPDDGRLEFARSVADARNPLTARVIVNRIWQQHFGRGLVATPDDFGATGERPSHPELLDHLASWFIHHGWSIKALHRYIMASSTWQQSSTANPAAMERDPGNRLVWRMSPRRLEFEALRDSLLRVAGRLDVRLGGRSAPLDDENVRRAVYGTTDRFRIPALLRNFDVANPDQSIARRAETSHPLQALYFLNSPFVRAQAEGVNRQPEIAELLDPRERIRALYRRILVRLPDPEEFALALQYLGPAPEERHWAALAQVLLMSNEFYFCD
ncbi:MAG: PSD1 and planctomycete cytochrome C domain-containing protein [Opitutaceae bacterium]